MWEYELVYCMPDGDERADFLVRVQEELHHQEMVSNFIEEEGLKGCYSTCFKDYVKVDESLLNENHCCSRKI